MVVSGDDLSNALSALPAELASRLDFILVLVKAIGGLVVIYLIFFMIRTYFLREQTKMIKEMKEDIAYIKKNLVKRKKK
jgi:predicted PurR-regulated permease PerM